MGKITFKLKDEQHVNIFKDGKKVGHVFAPSGSGDEPKHKSEEEKSSIQVCGFAEAFDLWGCANFPGFKDIKLFFDDDLKMRGKFNEDLYFKECLACYMIPCQCENKMKLSENDILAGKTGNKNPFTVKRRKELPKIIERRQEELVEDGI